MRNSDTLTHLKSRIQTNIQHDLNIQKLKEGKQTSISWTYVWKKNHLVAYPDLNTGKSQKIPENVVLKKWFAETMDMDVAKTTVRIGFARNR